MRNYGLTIDNLLSVEIVTADGSVLKASDEENQELFWGVKGGGGNFGVVTSFEYKLHSVGPIVYGGVLFYPLGNAEAVLEKYIEWLRESPDQITTLVILMTAPPAPFIPSHLQGTKVLTIAMCYNGSEKDGERLATPLRNLGPVLGLLGPIPYTTLQSMFDASAPGGDKCSLEDCVPCRFEP